MADPQLLELLDSGTRRLVRSVDGLDEAGWASPSLLPGWSRAHVVAHLTLNAEALSGALESVHEGRTGVMYASDEARDGDIEELATGPLEELRARFLGSTSVIGEWVEELADNLESSVVERTPGGRRFRAGDVASMRVREVEVHHCDLGLAYAPTDWPPAFVDLLLTYRAEGWAGTGFTAYAGDLGRAWTFGEGGPTVTGPGAALAWWATGRGAGEGLTSDDGVLPGTGPM